MFKELLEKLNKVMGFSQNFQTEKVKGSDETVEFAELKVGAEIFVSSPEGSVIAPDGDYELDNGAEIKVAEGKISEVVKEAPVEEEVIEEELAVEDVEEVKAEDEATDKEAELKEEIEALKEEIKSLKSQFSNIPTKEDLAKFQSDLSEELKKLEAIPTQFSQTDNRIELTDSTADKFKNLARFYKK